MPEIEYYSPETMFAVIRAIKKKVSYGELVQSGFSNDMILTCKKIIHYIEICDKNTRGAYA